MNSVYTQTVGKPKKKKKFLSDGNLVLYIHICAHYLSNIKRKAVITAIIHEKPEKMKDISEYSGASATERV